MLFMYLKHVITAGILSAALALGPGAAFAQTSGSSSGASGTSSQGTTGSQGSTGSQGTTGSQGATSQQPPSGTSTSSASSGQGSGGAGADQEAVRQHLSAAREALAELTKLPAASQLQGEQRQQVAQLISDFNTFATATTDWRGKYETIDRELDQILGMGATGSTGSMSGTAGGSAAGTSGSAAASTGTSADASTAGASGTSGAAGAAGAGGAAGGSAALDPTIIAKLQEVRKHLDGFEEASGDPTFVVEKIEKILDQAAGGASAGGAVGTSGSTGSAGSSASGGSVTLTASQVQELRRQLDSIKAAAKR
jgi:collagen type I/II/III/V/XI/XXIV/XXVII alpha